MAGIATRQPKETYPLCMNPAKHNSQGEKRALLLVARINITCEKKSVNAQLRVDADKEGAYNGHMVAIRRVFGAARRDVRRGGYRCLRFESKRTKRWKAR